jgi:hypothetical protein
MKRYFVALILMVVLLMGGMGAVALQQDSSQPTNNQKPPTTNKSNSHASEDTGEEVFQANCARCHMPPMSIPQRATGTIIMHMRMRARLSRQDEQLLLKYMAP